MPQKGNILPCIILIDRLAYCSLVGQPEIKPTLFIVCVLSNVTSIEQEKEYKMCLDAYNEKSNEKATLVNRLMEVVTLHLLQIYYNMRVLHFSV